jgi:hypothetical protein
VKVAVSERKKERQAENKKIERMRMIKKCTGNALKHKKSLLKVREQIIFE